MVSIFWWSHLGHYNRYVLYVLCVGNLKPKLKPFIKLKRLTRKLNFVIPSPPKRKIFCPLTQDTIEADLSGLVPLGSKCFHSHFFRSSLNSVVRQILIWILFLLHKINSCALEQGNFQRA